MTERKAQPFPVMPKILLALQTLHVTQLMWILFTLAPRILPDEFQVINYAMFYTTIMMSMVNLFFLGFRSLGCVQTCAWMHIGWTLAFLSYMSWLLSKLFASNCGGQCLSSSVVTFFALQSGVTVALKLILCVLWSYVLIKRVKFKNRFADNDLERQERYELEANPALEEPLPLYTKDDLPSYEDARIAHVVTVPSVQAIANEALPIPLVLTDTASNVHINANR
jgi:hypothetical protein